MTDCENFVVVVTYHIPGTVCALNFFYLFSSSSHLLLILCFFISHRKECVQIKSHRQCWCGQQQTLWLFIFTEFHIQIKLVSFFLVMRTICRFFLSPFLLLLTRSTLFIVSILLEWQREQHTCGKHFSYNSQTSTKSNFSSYFCSFFFFFE